MYIVNASFCPRLCPLGFTFVLAMIPNAAGLSRDDPEVFPTCPKDGCNGKVAVYLCRGTKNADHKNYEACDAPGLKSHFLDWRKDLPRQTRNVSASEHSKYSSNPQTTSTCSPARHPPPSALTRHQTVGRMPDPVPCVDRPSPYGFFPNRFDSPPPPVRYSQ